MTYPKIELHVHLEGTVRPGLLLRAWLRDIGAAYDWAADLDVEDRGLTMGAVK